MLACIYFCGVVYVIVKKDTSYGCGSMFLFRWIWEEREHVKGTSREQVKLKAETRRQVKWTM